MGEDSCRRSNFQSCIHICNGSYSLAVLVLCDFITCEVIREGIECKEG